MVRHIATHIGTTAIGDKNLDLAANLIDRKEHAIRRTLSNSERWQLVKCNTNWSDQFVTRVVAWLSGGGN